MSNTKIIRDVEGLIAMLGGPTKASYWAGCSVPAVCMWRTRAIPTGYHYRLDREARKRGYAIDPKLFGVDDDANTRVDGRADRASEGAGV